MLPSVWRSNSGMDRPQNDDFEEEEGITAPIHRAPKRGEIAIVQQPDILRKLGHLGTPSGGFRATEPESATLKISLRRGLRASSASDFFTPPRGGPGGVLRQKGGKCLARFDRIARCRATLD